MTAMKFATAFFFLMSAGLNSGAIASSPEDEWLVIQTNAGTLIFELDFVHASKTSNQIRTLVQLGVYDSVPVARIEPKFVVQFADASARATSLNASQRAALKPIELEVSNGSLRHVRGTLSLAHDDHRPNGGMTSFSIMLAEAQHLDGRFTAFGRLMKGDEVLTAISQVPTDSAARPTFSISIIRAFFAPRTAIENNPAVETKVNEGWRKSTYEKAERHRTDLKKRFDEDRRGLLALLLVFAVSMGVALTSRFRRSASTVAAVSGAGFFLLAFQYVALMNGVTSASLFAVLFVYFRLMSRFENRSSR